MKDVIALTAALALLAACSAKQPEAASNDTKEVSVNKAAAGAVIDEVAATDPQAAKKGLPVSNPTPVAVKITTLPTAYQGKWGLTRADCDISRADSKGLMRVSGNKLDFYESTGKVLALQKGKGASVTVDLAFTGEGQSWAAQNLLALEMGGTHLVRTDMSAHKTFHYQRC